MGPHVVLFNLVGSVSLSQTLRMRDFQDAHWDAMCTYVQSHFMYINIMHEGTGGTFTVLVPISE